MRHYYAEKGSIPKIGEVWQVNGPIALFTLHAIKISQIRPGPPEELRIVSIWPGVTLGMTLLSHYGPGSTLEYHEFAVMPALVRFGRSLGFWVSHLYVDSEKSVEGGRRLGFPKEMALFNWTDGLPGEVVVSKDDKQICAIHYGRPRGGFRFYLGGPSISIAGDKVMWMRHRLKASYGLCRVRIDCPVGSPAYDIGLGRPLVGIGGLNMTGFMCERQKALGFLPCRPK